MSDRPEWVGDILAAMAQNHAAVMERVAQSHAEIDQPRAEMGKLRTEVGQLRAEMGRVCADVMGRIDRLQDKTTTMRDEDAVNFGAAERAERIALNTREEVRAMGEQISAMVRQIRRLQSDIREIRGEP